MAVKCRPLQTWSPGRWRWAAAPVEAAAWPVVVTVPRPVRRVKTTLCVSGTGCPSRRHHSRPRKLPRRSWPLKTSPRSPPPPPGPFPPRPSPRSPPPPPLHPLRPRLVAAPALPPALACDGGPVATAAATPSDVSAIFSVSESPTTAARPYDRLSFSPCSLCPAAWSESGSGRNWTSTRPGSPLSLFSSPARRHKSKKDNKPKINVIKNYRRYYSNNNINRQKLCVFCAVYRKPIARQFTVSDNGETFNLFIIRLNMFFGSIQDTHTCEYTRVNLILLVIFCSN